MMNIKWNTKQGVEQHNNVRGCGSIKFILEARLRLSFFYGTGMLKIFEFQFI